MEFFQAMNMMCPLALKDDFHKLFAAAYTGIRSRSELSQHYSAVAALPENAPGHTKRLSPGEALHQIHS